MAELRRRSSKIPPVKLLLQWSLQGGQDLLLACPHPVDVMTGDNKNSGRRRRRRRRRR